MNDDPLLALAPIVAACDTLGIPYYVAGSLASSLYGVPRATNDVDVVLAMRSEHVGPFVESLAGAYYADQHMIRDGLVRGIPSNLIHLGTMVKIDLYDDRSMPFSVEAMGRTRTEELPGCPMPVRFASPEDVLLAKLRWYRDGGERSDRQWGDIIGILRVQGDALDAAYLGSWLDRLGVRDLHRRALEGRGA